MPHPGSPAGFLGYTVAMGVSKGEQIGKLERDLKRALALTDSSAAEPPVRRLITGILRDLTDVRLDIRDFEFADSLASQRKAGQAALRRLEKLHKAVLVSSEHGLLGAADVAEYSSRIDALTEDLRR